VVKNRQIVRKFDSKWDAHSNWELADPLDYAALNYAPFELAERFRDSGRDLHASRSIEFELRMLLRDRISNGEVLAFGIQISPEPKDKAEQIPRVLFQSPHAKIDWEQERIRGLDREFQDVKVCLREKANEPLEKPIAATEPRERGPKGYSKILEEAFGQLELEHKDFSDWSLEKQVMEIQRRSADRHPGRFKKSPPGRSTVYRFLSKRSARSSVS
jgi:hypothetical protein